MLYGNDDVFTKSGYDAFKKALDDQKMPVTTTETFAKGDVDFKAQLTKIKATNPDAIVLSALIAEGAPIMVQARQLGMNLPFIGGNGMNSVKVFDLAKGASDGLWVGSPWSIENRTPENNSFIIAYTKKYSSPPDQFAAQAYDAMHIADRGAEEGQAERRPGQGSRGAAGRAARGQVERRDRRVRVPPRHRQGRQARRLRRQPDADRQHHARPQLRNRKVIARAAPARPVTFRSLREAARVHHPGPRFHPRTGLSVLEQQLFNALSLGCVYALFALGFTLVFGVLGVVNLSQGAVFMVGAYAALTAITKLAFPLWAAILVRVRVLGPAGLLIDRLVLKPLRARNAPHLIPMIATIGLAIAINSLRAGHCSARRTSAFPSEVLPQDSLQLAGVSVTRAGAGHHPACPSC